MKQCSLLLLEIYRFLLCKHTCYTMYYSTGYDSAHFLIVRLLMMQALTLHILISKLISARLLIRDLFW